MAPTVYKGQIFETSTVANGQFAFSFEDSQGAFSILSAPMGNPAYLTSCQLNGAMTPYSSFPFRGVGFSIVPNASYSGVYDITLTLSEGTYLTGIAGLTNFHTDGGHFLSSLTASTGGGSVDLTSVMTALSSLDSHLTIIGSSVSTLGEQVYQANSKIDSLDLQIPDNLNTQLSELGTQIGNIDLTPLANISLPASLTGLTPIDITNLEGNFCKYLNGQVVYYGAYGLWEVVKSFLSLSADNQLTPFYDLRQNVAPVGSSPVYRYNTVPQDFLFPYIESSPATDSTTTTGA